MLETKDVIHHLTALAKLDIDAVHAYDSAIERIDLPDVKRQLTLFRGDHERHIIELSALIERLGGEAPKRTPDLKGFFIQGFTAIRSMMGNVAALKAMKGNEELTNKTYDKAMQLDLPSDVRTVVHRNLEDERRHLAYIEECLRMRVTEKPGETAA